MDVMDILGSGGSGLGATVVGMVLSVVLAIGGGIVLYFTFLSPKNEGKFTGFLGWLYDFLTFKKLMIESLLRILYLIITVYFVCAGFALLFTSFLGGIMMMVTGLVFTRIIYEFILLQILLYRNTTDINKKMGGSVNRPNTPSTATPARTPIAPTPVKVNPVPAPVKVDPIPTPVDVTPNPTPVEIDPIPAPEVVVPGPKTCPTCNATVADDAKFCVACGSKQN